MIPAGKVGLIIGKGDMFLINMYTYCVNDVFMMSMS